ncbi:MAG: hypothetical protein KatS3mg054_0456 [Chloroflexus sp.]|nr:MAG: hypothetical protein KatS3mg054_0428 [Chloroflexus sp.]GIV86427.1 MAG: hypothetical protein KatS3mg054_0456 [Chloroflexus sp.]
MMSVQALAIAQQLFDEYKQRYPTRDDCALDVEEWAARHNLYECWLLEDAAMHCPHAMYELRGRCDLPVFGE